MAVSNGHVIAMRQGCMEAEKDESEDDGEATQGAASAASKRASAGNLATQTARDRTELSHASSNVDAKQGGRSQLQ